MKTPRLNTARLLIVLLAAVAFAGADAQMAEDRIATAEYRNRVYDPAPAPHPDASLAQARSVAIFSGHVRPVTSGPSDGQLVLPRSSFGQPVSPVGQYHFDLGEVIREYIPAGADPTQPPVAIDPPQKAFWVPELSALVTSEPGFVTITWRHADGQPMAPVRYLISGRPARDPVALFHTHRPGTRLDQPAETEAPRVDVSALDEVIVHFNVAVPDNPEDPYILRQQNTLHAKARSGLVVLEYRDAGAYVGYEIVQVRPADVPDAGASPTEIGFLLQPFVAHARMATPVVTKGLDQQSPEAGFVYQHSVPSSSQFGNVFAVRKTTNDVSIEVFWQRFGVADVIWPYELHRYTADWPSDPTRYQIYVRDPVQGPGQDILMPPALNVRLMPYQAPPGHALEVVASRFSTRGEGWSLLQYRPGNNVLFQVVRSVRHNDPAWFSLTPVPWDIGTEITEATHEGVRVGYVHRPQGDRYDWEVYDGKPGDPANFRTLQIIAVNEGVLEVWWSKLNRSVQWPSLVKRYQCQWPERPEKIVIARQNGTGVIDPAVHRDFRIYYQNDPSQPGFNPNDEHALRRVYATGEAVFALRDDLGAPATSKPYVLVKHRDAGDRWRYRIFRVVAEEAPYYLRDWDIVLNQNHEPPSDPYEGEVEKLIQAPYPLNTLPGWEREVVGVSGPYWRDRKLFYWARAAGDDGGPAQIVLRYSYPVQSGFFFPGANPPPPGTYVPWLDVNAGTPGTPHDVAFTIRWPEAPSLRVGETLVKPKNGLPDISQQTSVEVIYEQSIANGERSSVQLIDPTRIREVSLAAFPPDVRKASQGGRDYFADLPPHLRSRLWHDPINHVLRYQGKFVEAVAGEDYLLLNVLTPRDRDVLLGLSQDPTFRNAVQGLFEVASQPVPVPPNRPFAKPLALTAGLGGGVGYVTLAFNNSTNLNQPADPISVEVIQVTCPVYRGEIKVVESDNPFDEQLTLRHSGDFAGLPQQFAFEWRTLPPGTNGLPQTNLPPEEWSLFTPRPASGQGAVDVTIAGPGLLTMSDNFFMCRYRPLNPAHPCGTNQWSAWTKPQIAEGWIKRVLAGIDPFEQRFKDYDQSGPNTIVSMISQAGARWRGSAPLNAAAANGFGLIEIYETIFKRGIDLSIEGIPPVNYPPANDALLNAAGRLADLYLLLGNEAYADSLDPTIGFGTEDGQYGKVASGLFCFMNQTGSLLEEELALLRGRDASRLPGVQEHPFYNRLVWNFTRGITEGEVAYALNYNIRPPGDAPTPRSIDEATAKQLYPQGHGDAWGHYLMALQYYYRLLRSPNFSWTPRIETILVGGVPISVDYYDERKFAAAAAAKAQAGAEIVNLTYRSAYVEDPAGQWQGYQDSVTNRAWGLSEWAVRAGQGAYFDWVVGNAVLPPTNSQTGIEKIDRTTVTELRDVVASFVSIQAEMDKADMGLNPLGLAKNVLPFDINPREIDEGTTHFEQIYGRAVRTMNNAIAVFDLANNSTQLLRRQADSLHDFQRTVLDREVDFTNRLVEVFGYPYGDDIGPSGTYPDGYEGPDIYHYMYVDPSRILGQPAPPTQAFTVPVEDLRVAADGSLARLATDITFHVAANGYGLIKPEGWTKSRRAPGEMQMAHSELLQGTARFQRALLEYDNLIAQIQDQADLLQAQFDLNDQEIQLLTTAQQKQESLNDALRRSRERQLDFQTKARLATLAANAVAESFPKIFGVIAGMAGGTIGDWTFGARSAVLLAGNVVTEMMTQNANSESLVELDHQQAKELVQSQVNISLTSLRQEQQVQQQLAQIAQMIRQEALLRLEIYNLQEALQQSVGRYASTLARGQRLLEERLRFRQQTAAQIQDYRYKDMAFRIFRNEALQKYRAQFDMAALYVYLAARAYDFDTNLRPNDPAFPGRHFMNKIIRARALGLIQNHEPITGGRGDPGLADPLAAMKANFQTLKCQIGLCNPQPSVQEFSLRSQLLRIQPSSAGSGTWRETLHRFLVPHLPDVAEFPRHCLFEATRDREPGLIIPFSTTIDQDLNFFGWPAGVGDGSFNPTAFSTKIRSVGVSLSNYRTYGGGGLKEDVYVYLVPIGGDILRSPRVTPQDTINFNREWKLIDQWLPIPFPISDKRDPRLAQPGWIPAFDVEVQQGFSLPAREEIRAHAAFEAFHDSLVEGREDPQFQSARLIGRSVWNTRWLLVIPAASLLNDRDEGLSRFIDGAINPVSGLRDGNGVSDIRIRFKTYAYTGR